MRSDRASRRRVSPACEPLEGRALLSGFTAPAGTISGAVIDGATGQGVPGVQIQLYNSADRLVARTRTNAEGLYLFRVRPQPDAYVVYEVTPRGLVQQSPAFALTPPVGSFNPVTAGTTSASQSASWNYGFGVTPSAGPVGPYAWDTIAPSADLPFQSPVDIPRNVRPIDLSGLVSIAFAPSVPTAIVNNGHQIQVQYPSKNGSDVLSLGGLPSSLVQFHFHDPSETTIGGRRFAMEEHFLATSANGTSTVVAVMVQLGRHNDSLQPILDAATASLTKPGSKTTIQGAIDFAGLLPADRRGWFYVGSLTTPPVAEPINWIVLATPITLDANQLAQYQAVATSGGFLPNARPTLPLHGRIPNRLGNEVVFAGPGVAGENFVVTASPNAG